MLISVIVSLKYAEGSVQVLHPIIMGVGGSPGPQVKCQNNNSQIFIGNLYIFES